MTFAVVVEGLENVDRFGALKNLVDLATVQMLNKIAPSARKDAVGRIMQQIAFPNGYLNQKGRLELLKGKATRAKPERVIRARGRPTSLARFAVSESPGRIILRVNKNKATFLRKPRAFLINLPAGAVGKTETRNDNRGLAMRLRPGEKVDNKIKHVQLGKRLVLLYGPSVQQVFLNNAGKGVATDMTPSLLDQMEREFLRLLNR